MRKPSWAHQPHINDIRRLLELYLVCQPVPKTSQLIGESGPLRWAVMRFTRNHVKNIVSRYKWEMDVSRYTGGIAHVGSRSGRAEPQYHAAGCTQGSIHFPSREVGVVIVWAIWYFSVPFCSLWVPSIRMVITILGAVGLECGTIAQGFGVFYWLSHARYKI